MSDQLAVQIALIPLIWLAVATLVVAACQVAARADACPPASVQEPPDGPTARDRRLTQDRLAMPQRSNAMADERSAVLHRGR